MLVLFPSDPFETHKPDPDWAQEVEIAKENGHEVAFIHYESLVNDNDPKTAVQGVPEAPEDIVEENEEGTRLYGTAAIYRGWMLTVRQYDQMYQALCADKNISLCTHPEQYANAHHFTGWYPELEEITPKSILIPKDQITMKYLLAMANLLFEGNEHGIIVKDYVKSRKHEWEEACFIPNAEAAEKVISTFLERQGDDLQGGIVLREFIPLKSIGKHPESGMPMSEECRIFWILGQPGVISEYWDPASYEQETHTLPEPDDGWDEDTVRSITAPKFLSQMPGMDELAQLANKVDNPFIAMDLAQTEDGDWIIIEIGDGQVSGFPQLEGDAHKFYSALYRIDQKLGHHIPEPLTQKDLDNHTCQAEGCDHKGHSTEMVLHPRCHMGTPTWTAYENGAITVKCSECDMLVARIAVAPGDVTVH